MLVHPWDAPIDPDDWRGFVTAQSFGQLIASGRNRDVPVVVPTQFLLDGDTVLLHLARPNPVWHAIDENPTVLLSVAGDWAYVPSAWKAVGDEDPAMGIPTTYYAAAQLTCNTEVVDDTDGKVEILRRQLAATEPELATADPSEHGRKLAGIRGLRLTVREVKAKFKYGGNVDTDHQLFVAEHFRQRGGPGDDAAGRHLQRRIEQGELTVALARFKDLCIDAVDGALVGEFWAKALGLIWNVRDDGSGWVSGPTPEHTIWICPVPEAKTVKNRVHLDIYARSLDDLESIGSTMLVDNPAWRWTIMADQEGGDYCAFLREELPEDRLHGLVVDCADPAAIATWWAQVYDAELVHHDQGYSTVQGIAGMPILTMDFVPVPEPKTVKNRVHWDVVAADIPALVGAGATVLREPDDEIRWTVMADPDGNEFCAFAPSASA